MAQRAIIGINGDLIPFDETLDKIRTQAIGGGGSVTWVPEADTRCTALTITANGSKSASDEGVYGWDYVVVSVPGSSVIGIDPATGQETAVTVNPETGDIVKTVVPVEIRVTTLPTKTEYIDGETIDYSGIVVHAYSSTGQDMGEVPYGELILPVTTADISQVSSETATSDLITEPFGCGSSGKVVIGPKNSTADDWYLYSANDSDGKLTLQGNLGGTRWDGIYASASPSGGYTEKHYYPGGGSTTKISHVNQTYNHNGRTVNYATWIASYSGGSYQIKEIAPTGSSGIKGEIAWTMIFGTITQGGQAIPVQWSQPETGNILETSFVITVGGAA